MLALQTPAICAFVNDQLDAQVLPVLAQEGVRLVAMRCAGFNDDEAVNSSIANLSRGTMQSRTRFPDRRKACCTTSA